MESGNIQLLVGLGNPGTKYQGTRHNIGFMVLEKLAAKEDAIFKKKSKLYGLLAEIGSGSNRRRLLMPHTYMNNSGKSIRATMDWFNLQPKEILLLVDDLDLPLGRIRLREKGTSGGHNGLLSTIQHLGTQDFSRLKIGIGAPKNITENKKEQTISHVLGTFRKEEMPLLEKVLEEVIIGLNLIQDVGIEKAGNRVNSFRTERT